MVQPHEPREGTGRAFLDAPASDPFDEPEPERRREIVPGRALVPGPPEWTDRGDGQKAA